MINYRLNNKKRNLQRIFFLCIIFYVFSALGVYGQHLAFMGIPIDGNINDFQSKLATKGIKVNSAKSKQYPVGQRAFSGKFQGYNSDILVYYNRKTKTVYKTEITIGSKNKDVIQKLLDKSLNAIEEKYYYFSDHDERDGTRLHYKYYIYPSKESNNCIGAIHVKPSYTFYATDETKSYPLELASFIITYVYEDAINTQALTPSTTEPYAEWRFSCGKPENLYNFIKWADNYRSNECYEKCILYLNWILDYYKYGCAPEEFLQYENDFENAILRYQSFIIGRIKTAYTADANVYRICDESTGRFKCIQFSVCDGSYHIKLDANDINQQIKSLERLKSQYAEKKARHDLQGRDTGITLPALVGEESFKTQQFGEIRWTNSGLMAKYDVWDEELRVSIEAEGYKHIFLFRSENDIDNYINFLRSINTY